MRCEFPREELALHVEDDLPEAAARRAAHHLATCEECRRFFGQLRARQSQLKTIMRGEAVSQAECTEMRRSVMAIVSGPRAQPQGLLRLERAIVLGFRRRSYAAAAVALFGIMSVSVLSQMRHGGPAPIASVAVFDDSGTLVLPSGYRDWMALAAPASSSSGAGHAVSAHREESHRVYISPSAYRQYTETGRFPEGTLIVREASSALLVSVKDRTRFAGGWGFFDFTGAGRTVRASAKALPESSGCRACHRQAARTDHVFTQFYPALRSARLESLTSAAARLARFRGRGAAATCAG